jgi:hypothetical protein
MLVREFALHPGDIDDPAFPAGYMRDVSGGKSSSGARRWMPAFLTST